MYSIGVLSRSNKYNGASTMFWVCVSTFLAFNSIKSWKNVKNSSVLMAKLMFYMPFFFISTALRPFQMQSMIPPKFKVYNLLPLSHFRRIPLTWYLYFTYQNISNVSVTYIFITFPYSMTTLGNLKIFTAVQFPREPLLPTCFQKWFFDFMNSYSRVMRC